MTDDIGHKEKERIMSDLVGDPKTGRIGLREMEKRRRYHKKDQGPFQPKRAALDRRNNEKEEPRKKDKDRIKERDEAQEFGRRKRGLAFHRNFIAEARTHRHHQIEMRGVDEAKEDDRDLEAKPSDPTFPRQPPFHTFAPSPRSRIS